MLITTYYSNCQIASHITEAMTYCVSTGINIKLEWYCLVFVTRAEYQLNQYYLVHAAGTELLANISDM